MMDLSARFTVMLLAYCKHHMKTYLLPSPHTKTFCFGEIMFLPLTDRFTSRVSVGDLVEPEFTLHFIHEQREENNQLCFHYP